MKMGSNTSVWNKISMKEAEVFATSTDVVQGKLLGLSSNDLKLFENYYKGVRK